MELDREQIIHATARNLVQAGAVSADEIPMAEEHLSHYSHKDLIGALMVSLEMIAHRPEVLVDVRLICLN